MKRVPWLGLALAAGLALAPAAHGAHGGAPSVAMTEPDYLKWLIDSRQPVVVVDLRAPDEFRRGHLPGAPGPGWDTLRTLVEQIQLIDKETPAGPAPDEHVH